MKLDQIYLPNITSVRRIHIPRIVSFPWLVLFQNETPHIFFLFGFYRQTFVIGYHPSTHYLVSKHKNIDLSTCLKCQSTCRANYYNAREMIGMRNTCL